MTIQVRVGRTEGFISSYNLMFDNGLRLMTENLTWKSAADRTAVERQFHEVVDALRAAGHTVVTTENP